MSWVYRFYVKGAVRGFWVDARSPEDAKKQVRRKLGLSESEAAALRAYQIGKVGMQ